MNEYSLLASVTKLITSKPQITRKTKEALCGGGSVRVRAGP